MSQKRYLIIILYFIHVFLIYIHIYLSIYIIDNNDEEAGVELSYESFEVSNWYDISDNFNF